MLNYMPVLEKKIYWQAYVVFFLAMLVLSPEVMAQTSNDAISTVLCNVVKQLNGPIGKGIATIAIIVLGIGLFLGKLSWGLAVATAIGIGMIFGAAQIVMWISAGTAGTGGNVTNICT
ncbi:Type IV secretory pathway, VirB2 components (pilins) [Rickettsiales bacterium Ac37b]|nr:Type IV secretory pathway, VirB2 components (pilins) [Rickettsiales bacterium Ac37b]